MDASRDSASNVPTEVSRHGQDVAKDCDKCGLDKQEMANPSQQEQLLKILGYTPVLSQLASVCCLALGHHDVACDLQRLFIQGIVNFFKRLFYMAHVLWTGQHLTIHRNQAHGCNHDFSAWMAPLQNERLWDLCLPGTHNSHAYACRPTPFGTDWVLCQRLSVRQQLEAGVRLLDFRLINETHFGHGPVETSRLDVVANDIVSFASMHPTEVVVCLVKANGKYTKLQDDANKSPAQVFQNALEDAWKNQTVHGKCRCATSISIDTPQSEHAATRLKHQTLKELTNNQTQGKVLIEAWSHWEGSWHYTNSNLAHEVEQKSREWAKRKSGHKPRVLELIMTVDAGETRKTIELALLHSVESLNHSLFPHAQQGDMLSATILCNIQAVLLDYPTEAQIHSIVSYNSLQCVGREFNGGFGASGLGMASTISIALTEGAFAGASMEDYLSRAGVPGNGASNKKGSLSRLEDYDGAQLAGHGDR